MVVLGRIWIESFPVPKLAPTAIRDQNSYVAHKKGMMPMMNTIVLVVPDNMPPSMEDGTKSPTAVTVGVDIGVSIAIAVSPRVDIVESAKSEEASR
mmetsp:Transcript_19904/g.30117  ORF Transcript_19904/g.30117 Transcript_19904/m.30117 type:complete len:96 (+) Transcript_19904:77-364(+)